MVKFYLRNPRAKISAIYAVTYYKGTRHKITIGESVKTAYWNKEKQRASESVRYPGSKELNLRLSAWVKVIEKAKLSNKITTLTTEDLKKRITELTEGSPQQKIRLLDWVYGYIDRCNKSERTIKNYKTTYSALKEFNQKITFQQIDLHFYKQFQTHCNKKGYALNTFGAHIKTIKAWMNEAEDEVGHGCTGHLHKKFTTLSETADTVYLTLGELNAIYTLQIDWELILEHFPDIDKGNIQRKIDALNLARERFLIGAFTGLRFSDFSRISSENIKGDLIKINPKKGGKHTVIIPMHQIVKDIIKGIDFSKRVHDQKINKHIKEVCRMAGIDELVTVTITRGGKKVNRSLPKWELVTTHTARRSAATNMFKAGIPSLSIMKITGHTTERSFLKYIRISEEENAELLKNHPYFN